MFSTLPQLHYRDVVKGLKKLGFVQRPKKSTAHEQWVCDDPFRKVTVDKHLSPFTYFLIKSMSKQAGVSPREFARLCKDKKYHPK